MKTTYKIIESPPYDKDAPNSFWIKKETVWLGFIKTFKIIGDYEMDNSFGKLGDCPFFDRKSAKKRIKILKQQFESAREASRQLNIDCGSISKCCRNKQKQCGGFTFKYITNENI